MRLLIDNLANKDNTAVNTQLSTFPALNQYTNVLVEKTFLTDFEDIDLGSAQNINGVSIKFTETGNTPVITLYGSSTPGGLGDFSLVITQDVHFIDETWRYWRIASTENIYLNNTYLGVYFQWPGVMNSPIPNELDTDIIGITNSSQIYVTEGDNYKELTVDIATSTRAEYEAFLTWYKSSDRKNNHILVLFEECMGSIVFVPFFAKLIGGIQPSRDIVNYDYALTFREGK